MNCISVFSTVLILFWSVPNCSSLHPFCTKKISGGVHVPRSLEKVYGYGRFVFLQYEDMLEEQSAYVFNTETFQLEPFQAIIPSVPEGVNTTLWFEFDSCDVENSHFCNDTKRAHNVVFRIGRLSTDRSGIYMAYKLKQDEHSTDPKIHLERLPADYVHDWGFTHEGQLLGEFWADLNFGPNLVNNTFHQMIGTAYDRSQKIQYLLVYETIIEASDGGSLTKKGLNLFSRKLEQSIDGWTNWTRSDSEPLKTIFTVRGHVLTLDGNDMVNSFDVNTGGLTNNSSNISISQPYKDFFNCWGNSSALALNDTPVFLNPDPEFGQDEDPVVSSTNTPTIGPTSGPTMDGSSKNDMVTDHSTEVGGDSSESIAISSSSVAKTKSSSGWIIIIVIFFVLILIAVIIGIVFCLKNKNQLEVEKPAENVVSSAPNPSDNTVPPQESKENDLTVRSVRSDLEI